MINSHMTQTNAIFPYSSFFHVYVFCYFNRRCLGVDFLPFLPMVITKLLVAISQDLSSGTGGIDLEELEQRFQFLSFYLSSYLSIFLSFSAFLFTKLNVYLLDSKFIFKESNFFVFIMVAFFCV